MAINEPLEHSDLKDYGTSVVRTVSLPLVVAIVISFVLKTWNIDLNEWEPILTAVSGYSAYAVVRFLEVFASPKWGYILGLPKTPAYR